MPEVWIILHPSDIETDSRLLSPAIAPVVTALKRAILTTGDDQALPAANQRVDVLTTIELEQAWNHDSLPPDLLLCPLTLEMPLPVPFAGRQIFTRCREVETLRQQVAAWGYPIGEGDHWLPIVQTAKGAIYGEVIGRTAIKAEPDSTSPVSTPYRQPIHLTDVWRQPLYHLAQALMRSLDAPPAVYLMQFGLQVNDICFDRLIPFPAEAASATLGVQQPDLLTCHWRCLTRQPIQDLIIRKESVSGATPIGR